MTVAASVLLPNGRTWLGVTATGLPGAWAITEMRRVISREVVDEKDIDAEGMAAVRTALDKAGSAGLAPRLPGTGSLTTSVEVRR